MTTLKDAQKSGNLEQFIKEHSKDPKGDADQLKEIARNLALDIRPDPKFIKKGKAIPKA
jgi:hypothetical protein